MWYSEVVTTDYTTASVRDLLDAFASPDPLPGGGSAAALAASLGVSLLTMVASMSRTRTANPAESLALREAAARLQPIREALIALIEEDSRAYLAVIAAYRQPKDTDDQRAARTEAIQNAVRWAIDVPLRTMRWGEQALREATPIVRVGNPNAVTDAIVGARLLMTALESAGLNVDVNVPAVTDTAYARRASEERQALEQSARESLRAMPSH